VPAHIEERLDAAARAAHRHQRFIEEIERVIVPGARESLKWQTICHDVEKTRSFSASRKSGRGISSLETEIVEAAAGLSVRGERFASMILEPLFESY